MTIKAAERAIHEWGGSRDQITHMVASTCTASSNPGYDHLVATRLTLQPTIEKVLLHGIGCSGGLAGLRLAANLVLSAAYLGKKATVLVVACEITSTLARLELDRIAEGQLNIGVTIFSDGAGALIVTSDFDAPSLTTTNGTNGHSHGSAIYEILGWKNLTVPDTEADLGFDASSLGWRVVLSPRVPKLTALTLPRLFKTLMGDLKDKSIQGAPDQFDWALHPGGAAVLKTAEQALSITPQHMQASWHVYRNHGNCSSPTIIQVLDTLRHAKESESDRRDYVIAAAFGPGINAEGAVLKKLY